MQVVVRPDMDLSALFSLCPPLLFCLVVFVNIASVPVCGNGACDPAFKSSVEKCMQNLSGFPWLSQRKTLYPADWDRTRVICKWKLVEVASICIGAVYMSCPKVHTLRYHCGFQTLNPGVLKSYGKAVCRHVDVLSQYWPCLNSTRCLLDSCLSDYDAFLPSRMSTGMWKSPISSQHCSYHAHAEFCHERTLTQRCPWELVDAQMDILNVTRPASCSGEEMDRLRRRLRLKELYAIFNGATSSTRDQSVAVLRTSISVASVVFGWWFRRTS